MYSSYVVHIQERKASGLHAGAKLHTVFVKLRDWKGSIIKYGRTYVRPVDRFMPARMVETGPQLVAVNVELAARTAYSGPHQRHSEIIFRAFPTNQMLVS